jgi:cytochrome c peroxidase
MWKLEAARAAGRAIFKKSATPRTSNRISKRQGSASRDAIRMFLLPVITVTSMTVVAATLSAQKGSSVRRIVPIEELFNTIGPLKGVKPLEADVSEYVIDPLAAQQLGKALFWDIQVGSHGVACASCHFHAGADIRTKNQIDPGVKAGDGSFSSRWQKAGSLGPNKELTAADFPLHRLDNPNDREARVVYDSNDVTSSQGSFGGLFVSSNLGAPQRSTMAGSRLRPAHAQARNSKALPSNENCSDAYDPAANPFHANNLIYRKVEPRQTPTVINAVFNFRQFWDGRANNQFNGVDPFGPRTFWPQVDPAGPGNPNAKRSGTLVAVPGAQAGSASLRLEQRLIDNSSLASQAVGPPLSDFEMSCGGKTFADLGRKLIPVKPLAHQKVHSTDSLLSKTQGLLAKGSPQGLETTYKRLIERAFHPKFWSDQTRVVIADDGSITPGANGFTQMEHNFALFWGLAIQAYEALLVSDNSPFDRARNGDPAAMSDQARAGEIVFVNKGGCIGCHYGPVMSGATKTIEEAGQPKVIEHMRVGNGSLAFYDNGFYNIGVRPTAEDLGVGATDPYGFDLSFARGYKWRQLGRYSKSPDRFDSTPCSWLFQFWPCADEPTWMDPKDSERDAVDGAFKVPILRNVGLNPPYFHNGGQATLKDVVRFYSRGGDRRGPLEKDTSGLSVPNSFGQINDSNLDPDIGEVVTLLQSQNNALALTEAEIDDVVQFLLALSDERVACHSNVFDHPELPLPMGQMDVAERGSQHARDIVRTLPAVGQGGLAGIGKPCFPNSGALFGSVNPLDPRPLQATFNRILDNPNLHHQSLLAGHPNLNAANNAPAGPVSAVPGNVPAGGLPGAGTAGAANGNAPGIPIATGGPIPTITGVPGTPLPAPGATAGPVIVQPTLPPPVPAPQFTTETRAIHAFTIIGFLQAATVSGSECPGLPARQWGGTATVNGIAIVIPCNTVLQMPASSMTWAELLSTTAAGPGVATPALTLPDVGAVPPVAQPSIPFSPWGSPAGAAVSSEGFEGARPFARRLVSLPGGTTGGNTPPAAAAGFSYPSTEVQIHGNIVAGRYIAGLVFISQQSLNTASGIITGFDYAKGVILVGDLANGPARMRVELNDPAGRFSKGQSPDRRFAVDDANPTVRAATAYPMCVPRTDPAQADDPLCPQRNRPLASAGCRNFAQAGVAFPTARDLFPPLPGQRYCSSFVMVDPASAGTSLPLATQQAPFQIGDFITVSGTLLKGDAKGPAGSDTISAHTVIANVGIFTQPGTLPAYLAIGEFRIGNFTPLPIVNGVVQELPDRLVLEAVVTDVKSVVDIYLVDIDPGTGKQTQRWVTPGTMTGGIGSAGSNGHIIDGGITTQFDGPVPGRVRIRANKAVPGLLDSPSRNIRVAVRTLCDPANINGIARLIGSNPASAVGCLERAPAANGLSSGQYMAPTIEYLLPENVVPGDAPLPNNFWNLGFLVNGEGPGTGRLMPQPW